MTTSISETSPDRNLLDHNFEGYKFKLHNKESLMEVLKIPALRISPRTQCTLYDQICGPHNFLVGEKCSTHECVYFIDREKTIRKAVIHYPLFRFQMDTFPMWKFPDDATSQTKNRMPFMPRLKLISNNLAVACNGYRTFWLLETGDRSIHHYWRVLHSEELLQGRTFFIQDAVLKGLELHVLLGTIETTVETREYLIHWITFIYENNVWRQKSLKELNVEGICRYIYLERSCEAIYVASTFMSQFVFDSENVILDTSNAVIEHLSRVNFKWSQDKKCVAIHFIMPDNIERDDVRVTCTTSFIKVDYKDSSLLCGALYAVVHEEQTTISITKNLIEITIAKIDDKEEWSSVLRDFETRIQYVGGFGDYSESDPESNDDDDLPISIGAADIDFRNSEHTILDRICGSTHKITDRYSLGPCPVLFSMEANNSNAPSFGVSHADDICVWKPCFAENSLALQNPAILLRMGHIQSTTANRRFICCPSNYAYTLISDMSGHIFYYSYKTDTESGESVNRIPKKGVRKIISIPNGEEVLGIYPVPLGFYVLCEMAVMYFEL